MTERTTRRVETAQRWPWERPFEQLERDEHAELRMLRWIIDAQVALGGLMVEIVKGQRKAVALLDGIKAAIDADRALTVAEHDEVAVALAALTQSVADLQAQVEALKAGTVSQAELDAVASGLADLGTDIGNIYTAPEPPPAG